MSNPSSPLDREETGENHFSDNESQNDQFEENSENGTTQDAESDGEYSEQEDTQQEETTSQDDLENQGTTEAEDAALSESMQRVSISSQSSASDSSHQKSSPRIPTQNAKPSPQNDTSLKDRLTQEHKSKTLVHSLTNAMYEGPVKNLRMEGDKAQYHFPNGDYYEGGFLNGTFHGEGIIYFKGGAQLKGTWEKGELKDSRFFFADDLEWKDEDWDYCLEKYADRRLWVEKVTHETNNREEIFEKDAQTALSIKEGIKPAIPGKKQVQHLQSIGIVRQIPKGTYDTGDGYFVPSENVVKDYERHEVVREVHDEDERNEILTQYRVGRD